MKFPDLFLRKPVSYQDLAGTVRSLLHARGGTPGPRPPGEDAQAVSYIEAETGDGRVLWGVGVDSNIVTASLKAVTCAANRAAAISRV